MIIGTLQKKPARVVRKDVASLPPRGALAATMLFHGVDKMRSGEQTAQFFQSLGIPRAPFWARATAIAEVAAGGLLLAGIFTRPAAVAVLVTQAMAVRKVHARNGFAVTKGGYEFNLALMAIAAGVLLAGPGRYSVHEVVEHAVDARSIRRRLFGKRPRASWLSRFVRLVK